MVSTLSNKQQTRENEAETGEGETQRMAEHKQGTIYKSTYPMSQSRY